MSHKMQLLDCTLRDGGYVNDWKFGHINIIGIFERLAASGIDVIEIGFLDERRPFDIDKTIMPNTASADKIYEGVNKGDSEVVAMIDYGTCSIKNIQPCNETFIDGIRVIFKEALAEPALKFCKEVKSLGYKVYAQLVSVTTYSDDALIKLSKLVNDVKPYALSMVDTYGLLFPDTLNHIFEILDKNISPEIKIGFHGHNNFQMAYANSLSFLSANSNRDIIIDGTIYGMGKSAGNSPIELLAMSLNNLYGKKYRIGQILEAMDENIIPINANNASWGYKPFFYLCAKNQCHPNYLSYLNAKDNLSKTKIDVALSMIEPEEKKLMFDKNVAEEVYQAYLKENEFDEKTAKTFPLEVKDRKVLLIGPGKNIYLQKKAVISFIKKENPYVISINYIPSDFDIDCVFITNSKRFNEMSCDFCCSNEKFKTLATTNVEAKDFGFNFVVNRAPLLERNAVIPDNSFLMMLKLLIRLNITDIYCAGFDGYSQNEDNYFIPSMEYSFVKTEAGNLNSHIKNAIGELREKATITFVTYSSYDYVEDINSASI